MIRTILLVIALVSGGGALLLVMQGPATSAPETAAVDVPAAAPAPVDAPPEPEAAVEPVVELAEVLAVARDIAEGAELRPQDFDWIDWPAELLLSGFILREDEPDAALDLAGLVARFDLAAGDPVLAAAFEAPRPVEDTVALNTALRQIGAGMRPVSVPVEVVRPLGSVLQPGDHVDLVHVYVPDDADVAVSRILVTDARILAIDPEADTGLAPGPGDAVRNVVLALSVRDATEVLAATQVGALTLLLRDPGEAGAPTPPAPPRDLAGDIASGWRGFVLAGVDLAASGQVRPGDRVDIIFTPAPGDELWPSSRALVSNARVIGPAAGPDPAGSDQPSPSDRITLELDPAGVEAVTTALQRGQVSISLRSDSEADPRYHVQPLPAPAVQVRVRRAGEL
ncbi:Flp pilus assembly protein CpaB [Roseicyclus persicicus]|uniref:Flp pilus assembly protein CpaB n=1 Tax=Roseicyclus persicicus TaxID=2650661 RepID=A0A7X6GVL5_9RHOB|nr:Flp pilus assembly protein CpaB [Roseibacterium persicicum]NKX43194.1 Flp pilus assembly protein CpaB [Roseibacterium persicicum]